MKLGIQQKLALIFFLFFLVFSGTVFVLLANVQRIVASTEHIVSKNTKIAELTESLQTSLVDMDANIKKLNLLKKKSYFEYFETSRASFEMALEQTEILSQTAVTDQPALRQLIASYKSLKNEFISDRNFPENGGRWVPNQILVEWKTAINTIKKQNQQQINSVFQELNEASRVSARNGFIGFCISILVGCIGVWYISRSIFSPLKTLSNRLRGISFDTPQQPIRLRGGEEFNELAVAFNDMSSQLNEEETLRTEFIATLSHEIRTPLSSIHESVNMIVEEVFGSINEKQRRFLEIANGEIKRMNKLLDHLLNVAILEVDARKANALYFDTERMVINSAELFSAPAEKKQVTITQGDFTSCPKLFGVREEIQQVFVNIIGNAVKYSPVGGEVKISWEPDRDRKFLCFHVSDCGPGIADDEKSLIFTKYYRTKDVRGHLDGVGLGLSISHRIVTSYGGHIKVRNNQDKGCTFTFTLPTGNQR